MIPFHLCAGSRRAHEEVIAASEEKPATNIPFEPFLLNKSEDFTVPVVNDPQCSVLPLSEARNEDSRIIQRRTRPPTRAIGESEDLAFDEIPENILASQSWDISSSIEVASSDR